MFSEANERFDYSEHWRLFIDEQQKTHGSLVIEVRDAVEDFIGSKNCSGRVKFEAFTELQWEEAKRTFETMIRQAMERQHGE